ncbi:MAG: heme o synthase [Planctomycetota bacterium]|nr:heme o synthase [Planctomycetota bacterium]
MPDPAPAAESVVAAPEAAAWRRGLRQYAQLTKARLSALVLMTTAVGFALAGTSTTGTDWWCFFATIVGTALAAGAANTLNQVLEIRLDAMMDRTRRRPLPTGELSLRHAWILAIVLALAGLAMLFLFANALAAMLALLTILIYAALYTPLKRWSPLNTLVGAVCGAIPPMIGWAGARGSLDAGAWVLGALLFVWQIPHFLALAWVYRGEYARARFAMLPVVDPDGTLTGRIVLLTSLMLVPLTLTATLLGLAGWIYTLGALVLSLWLLSRGVRLLAQRTDANARGVFIASIIYLALVLALMVIDRGPIGSPAMPHYAAGPVTDLPATVLPAD